ncbi:L,D-transpeptidase family protein [Sphingosinithalassobacter sp. CS137]|uniref:L,D-transpeptidase family protein n=1 Tax=Sphingosinithalassobacter sp. CS137 TaxID=2762748 RepID=UPI00165E655A|nr:L,D-transpeptidase family protein [Sphingosinithalassobacter sp. CS137]
MKRALLGLAAGALAACAPGIAAAQSLDAPTVMETVEALQPGEFLWMPEVAPEGPVLLIVNVRSQRAVVYRNGVPIGVSTVSTGREGHETPLGVFTILQKRERHFSNLYDNAPMPFMQRLTWGGVALHGGHLPGYPASHGCIRLPHEFARLLFGATRIGMTVAVVDQEQAPLLAPDSAFAGIGSAGNAPFSWTPERAPDGPVSVLVSTADREVTVLRNGIPIGRASVEIAAPVAQPMLFALQSQDADGMQWLRLALPGQDDRAEPGLRGDQFEVSEGFRQRLLAILHPGATVIVTNDSLRSAPPAGIEALLDAEAPTADP